MKKLTLIFLFFSSTHLFGQAFDLYAGLHGNSTIQTANREYFSNSFKPLIGYRLGANILFGITKRDYKMKAGISFTDYSGEFRTGSYSSSGIMNLTEAKYWNHAINLDFYPLNHTTKKGLEIAVGLNYSIRVHSKIEGAHKYKPWNKSIQSSKITYLSATYGSKTTVGLLFNFIYPFQLQNNWIILPQLHTNVFITNEYNNISKCMFMAGLGIRKKLPHK